MEIPQKLLKRLTSCYGSWGRLRICGDCPLAVVCRIYRNRGLFRVAASQLLDEKEEMHIEGVVNYRDSSKQKLYHEKLSELLESEEKCKIVEEIDPLKSSEHGWLEAMSQLNLYVCEKCSYSGCMIPTILGNLEEMKSCLKNGNVPKTKDVDYPPRDCPYEAEHFVSKDT